MEYVEYKGKNVDEAITNACVALGIAADKLDYDVVEKGSNGFLGFGSKPAIIKARKNESVEDIVTEFLNKVFSAMELTVKLDIKVEEGEKENTININVIGDDMGILIGKRGQTLDSLQYLVSLVVNKESDKFNRVKLDTENYRERRKATLENLARNISLKVKRIKKPVALEPMNPYERRIIHTSVQKVNGAISWSEGENANRHVVIGPDPKAKPVRRNGGYNNRGRGGRRPYSANRSEHNTPANPDRKPLNEGGATGLYGRIDK